MNTRTLVQRNSRLYFAVTLLMTSFPLVGAPTTSRYFPFVDDPSSRFQPYNNEIKPSLFMMSATGADHRSGRPCTVSEMDGPYDLNDLINSLNQYNTQAGLGGYTNPLPNNLWKNKSLIFRVENKVRSSGLVLAGEHSLNVANLSLGYSLPLMYVTTVQRFSLDTIHSDAVFQNDQNGRSVLSDSEHNQLDEARRKVQSDLGLKRTTSTAGGLGDVDLHVSWNKVYDHPGLLRTLKVNLRAGVLCPAGKRLDANNASTVPFGSGVWANYLQAGLEAELKPTWRAGATTSITWGYKDTRNRRISVYKEPTAFSPLVGKVSVQPGPTFQLAPYFVLEHIIHGFHAHLGYTYAKHWDDKWTDVRANQTIQSYLNQTAGGVLSLADNDIKNNKDYKTFVTSWRAHYLTAKLTYDSAAALQKWPLKPTFYASFDYPIMGRGIAKSVQLSVGAGLHF